MAEVESGKVKILIVDDEERIRDACTMVLEDKGYEVATADNGQLGLKMIEEEYFDVVRVQDAHARERCKDLNGADPWACSECDCSDKLEARLATWGPLFRDTLPPDS